MSLGGQKMAQKRLGLVVSAPDSSAVLTSIANLEQRGIPAAWLTSAGAGGADPLGALAGAALRRSTTKTSPHFDVKVTYCLDTRVVYDENAVQLHLHCSRRQPYTEPI